VPCVAHGATNLGGVCADCYRCLRGSVQDCTGGCVYDENYCMRPCPDGQVWDQDSGKCIGLVVVPCPGIECSSPHELNIETCTCECPETEFAAVCTVGYTFSNETCQCEKDKCASGYYFGKNGCTECPDFTSGVSFQCGVHSSNDGQNGIMDCYKRAVSSLHIVGEGDTYCNYSDDTGTYEFSDDCYYSTLTEVPIQ